MYFLLSKDSFCAWMNVFCVFLVNAFYCRTFKMSPSFKIYLSMQSVQYLSASIVLVLFLGKGLVERTF